MTERYRGRLCRQAIAALSGVALLIICAILFTWAWNAIAVDLFQLPKARFKHALAFETAVVGFALLVGWAARLHLWRTDAARNVSA